MLSRANGGAAVWGFQTKASDGGGHILSHQVLEFSNALFDPGASGNCAEQQCGVATP
jgi:hypothetical protein